MIWVTDTIGQVIYFKADWEVLTGQPVSEAQGRGWLEKVHPEDRSIVLKIFQEANIAKEQFVLTYRVERKNGGFCWTVSSASPSILPDTGEFVGFLGALKVLDDRDDLAQASGRIGNLRPPSQVLDGAFTTAIESLADQVLYARALAEEAGEPIILSILDIALVEIGHRLAQDQHAFEQSNS